MCIVQQHKSYWAWTRALHYHRCEITPDRITLCRNKSKNKIYSHFIIQSQIRLKVFHSHLAPHEIHALLLLAPWPAAATNVSPFSSICEHWTWTANIHIRYMYLWYERAQVPSNMVFVFMHSYSVVSLLSVDCRGTMHKHKHTRTESNTWCCPQWQKFVLYLLLCIFLCAFFIFLFSFFACIRR